MYISFFFNPKKEEYFFNSLYTSFKQVTTISKDFNKFLLS
jgi:hypothetical protein